MTQPTWNQGSFRDPSSRVFMHDQRVFRALSASAQSLFVSSEFQALLQRLVKEGRVVQTRSVAREDSPLTADENWAGVVEHEKLPYITYAFEWPFRLLRKAAVFHLALIRDALKSGYTLSDATSYNVQFRGVNPLFIDTPSFIPFHDGDIWQGHRQFCEQFLNPLLLTAVTGVPYHAMLRGALNGIPSTHIAPLLGWRQQFSMNAQLHVIQMARLQSHGKTPSGKEPSVANKRRGLTNRAKQLLLESLQSFCETLTDKSTDQSVWSEYETVNSYDAASAAVKAEVLAKFCQQHKPGLLLDIGCNSGRYSELALQNGAQSAIGLDGDLGALDRAVLRAERQQLNFLPLVMDCTNPSPAMGWNCAERASLHDRISADAAIALALIHHLVIGANIPLEQAMAWLTRFAPRGIIEFVPKSDVMVQTMLSTRADIFPHYHLDAARSCLAHLGFSIQSVTLDSGRTLLIYERATR